MRGKSPLADYYSVAQKRANFGYKNFSKCDYALIITKICATLYRDKEDSVVSEATALNIKINNIQNLKFESVQQN
jgi:hypothetical protein